MKEALDKTTLGALKRFIARVEKDKAGMPINNIDDTEITFEFICASFFPTIMKNVDQRMSDEHTAGYMEGVQDTLKDLKKEKSNE